MQERLRLHDDMHYILMVCVNDFGRADMRQLDQPYNRCSWCRKVFLLSHRTVPNEAGDHRAARTPPWQGAVR